MNPTQLSYELRKGKSPDLTRRRWIIGLSLLGTAMGQLVSLYQTGIIRRLPDPPLPLIDSSRVDASDYAYQRFDTPDGVMMVATYAVTAWLAAAGGKDRAREQPMLPLAMGAKLLYDVLTTVRLGREEWQENKAFCIYCQTATVATLASALLAMPEVRHALDNMRSHPQDGTPQRTGQPPWPQRVDQTSTLAHQAATSP
ncbi:MAG: vitamin K epoxide reductase family protein [Caldilineaceae bacterium]